MIVPLSGHLISQKWFSKSVRLFFWYHLCDIHDLQCISAYHIHFSWYSVCWGSQETNLKDIKNVKSRNEPNGFVSIESKEQNHRLTCRRFVGAPQMYFKRLGMLLEILDFSYVKMFKQVLKIVPSRELTFFKSALVGNMFFFSNPLCLFCRFLQPFCSPPWHLKKGPEIRCFKQCIPRNLVEVRIQLSSQTTTWSMKAHPVAHLQAGVCS